MSALILAVTATAIVGGNHKIMKTMMDKKFEFWGIAFILASSFIQIFFLSPSQSLTNDAIRWKIEEKLDHIFAASRSNFKKLHPDINITWDNPDQLNQYKYAEMDQDLQTTQKQTNFLKWIAGIVFIIGSSLLLTGKYFEINGDSGSQTSKTR